MRRVTTTEVAPDRARYSDLLRIGEFRAMFVAHIVSMLGNIVADVALTVLVYQRTHSPALAASTMSLSFVPYLFSGLFLSATAQRWRSRRTLIACDVICAVVVAVMAIPRTPVVAILCLLFVMGLIAPIFQGVRAASLPSILPAGAPYVLGRSMFRLVAQGAQVAGFALGGLLLIAVSARGALVIDAVSFIGSAGLLRLGTKERQPATAASEQSVVRASLRNVRQVLAIRRLRRVMLIEWLLPTCMVAPEALAAPYVARLGLPSHAVGFWLTAIPVGTVLADVAVARLMSGANRRRMAVPSMLVTCAALLVFGAQPSFAVAFALLVIVGLGNSYQPAVDQELMDAAPEPLLGAALSISTAGLMFCQGVGFGVWGIVAEFVAPPYVVVIAGCLALVAVLCLRPFTFRGLVPTRDARPSPVELTPSG
jgi:MFS family permease